MRDWKDSGGGRGVGEGEGGSCEGDEEKEVQKVYVRERFIMKLSEMKSNITDFKVERISVWSIWYLQVLASFFNLSHAPNMHEAACAQMKRQCIGTSHPHLSFHYP